jgi:hypothetical protein
MTWGPHAQPLAQVVRVIQLYRVCILVFHQTLCLKDLGWNGECLWKELGLALWRSHSVDVQQGQSSWCLVHRLEFNQSEVPQFSLGLNWSLIFQLLFSQQYQFCVQVQLQTLSCAGRFLYLVCTWGLHFWTQFDLPKAKINPCSVLKFLLMGLFKVQAIVKLRPFVSQLLQITVKSKYSKLTAIKYTATSLKVKLGLF